MLLSTARPTKVNPSNAPAAGDARRLPVCKASVRELKYLPYNEAPSSSAVVTSAPSTPPPDVVGAQALQPSFPPLPDLPDSSKLLSDVSSLFSARLPTETEAAAKLASSGASATLSGVTARVDEIRANSVVQDLIAAKNASDDALRGGASTVGSFYVQSGLDAVVKSAWSAGTTPLAVFGDRIFLNMLFIGTICLLGYAMVGLSPKR